ncbi:MAG TPA: oxidoreductase [Chloroflexi bacterium]|nr:oxidoreductase [Chloroflexota bacterium]|tara:strand:- start:12518 stop:14827 length:2310 start_codon:yes stop_codon:yes gene_type:complete
MAVETRTGRTVKHHDNTYNVIGTTPIRHDGVEKVTGEALYGSDINLPGQFHGKVLRSPHAHARILSIDTSRAEALDGVHAVITGQDIPEPADKIISGGEGDGNLLKYKTENILARAKTHYHGHPVAAVAAISPHIAGQAVKLIDVTYEVLPAVLEVREAMAPDAPIIIEDLLTELDDQVISETPSNIAEKMVYETGDVDQGFEESDLIVDREFSFGVVHQGYIETHNATAHWLKDGNIHVWCSSQGAFSIRSELANILDHPITKIHVTPMEIGGGFGGKTTSYLEPLAALLSRKSGRPVKMNMDRDEVLKATGPTPGGYVRVKLGVTNAGIVKAGYAELAFDAGGFPGSVVGAGCKCVFAPYNMPNAKVVGYDVVVNKPKTHAYRAPGATHAEFASETVVDEICRELGLDPVEFRLQNSAKEGDWQLDEPPYARIGHIECVEAARDSDHWQTPLEQVPGKLRGRGIASGFWFNVGLTSSAIARLNSDGSVTLLEGSTDIGGTRTSVAMQFAETLGISVDDVFPIVADTDSVGQTDVTGGSRVTFATGIAAHDAANDMKQQIIAGLADLWEMSEDAITHRDGTFLTDGKSLTVREAALLLTDEEIFPVGRATVTPERVGGAFTTHIADVEVDGETGKVEILRYTAVQDAGVAIYPPYVEGQIQGGVVQGIGWALNEDYVYDDKGLLRNSSLLDYRMPTALDVPNIETIIVEVPNPGHPYGVRGVGEVPIVPPPAAVANAIHDATGLRLRDLPMSPARVQAALTSQNGDQT